MKNLLIALLALCLSSQVYAQSRSTAAPNFVHDSGLYYVAFHDSMQVIMNLDSNATPLVYVELMLTEIIGGITQPNAVLDTYFLPDYSRHIIHTIPGLPGSNYHLDITLNAPGHTLGQYNTFISTLGYSVGITEQSVNTPNIWNVQGTKLIRYANVPEHPTMRITNIMGQSIMSSEILDANGQFDASQLRAGIYFATLWRNGEVLVMRKIVIQ